VFGEGPPTAVIAGPTVRGGADFRGDEMGFVRRAAALREPGEGVSRRDVTGIRLRQHGRIRVQTRALPEIAQDGLHALVFGATADDEVEPEALARSVGEEPRGVFVEAG